VVPESTRDNTTAIELFSQASGLEGQIEQRVCDEPLFRLNLASEIDLFTCRLRLGYLHVPSRISFFGGRVGPCSSSPA